MADSSQSPWKLGGHGAKLTAGDFSAAVTVDRPGLGIHDIAWGGQPLEALRSWLAFGEVGPATADQRREIEDAYVRGRDLVVIYAESKQHPLRYVVYWRSLCDADILGAMAGLDVVVSVQTSVLDAKPAAWLSSEFSADRAWSAAPPQRAWQAIPPRRHGETPRHPREAATSNNALGNAPRDDVFLFDLAGADWSYAEMIHPDDRMFSDALVNPMEPAANENAPSDIHARIALASPFVITRHHLLGLRLEKGVLLRARTRALLMRRTDARNVVAACRDAFEHAELPLTT